VKAQEFNYLTSRKKKNYAQKPIPVNILLMEFWWKFSLSFVVKKATCKNNHFMAKSFV